MSNLAIVENRRAFSLSEVTTRLNKIITEKTEGKTFWVQAEISSGKIHQKTGHFYCDFIESENGRQVAKMRGMIWESKLTMIQNKFKKAQLEFNLESGNKVTLLCEVQFHPVHGLSLNGVDADPAYALGEIERRRREILLRLEHEGLFDRNKQTRVPLLPKKIGLITSKDSAAYKDFFRTIQQSSFGLTVFLADSPMQGKNTESGVLRSLKRLSGAQLDLIVILRGGGSKADLAYLDSELIARRIADSPAPVWTAIGHESDTSVLDFVAHSTFKTPTAVAVGIVALYSSVENKTEQALLRLKNTWSSKSIYEEKSLTRRTTGLIQGSRKLSELARANLREKTSRARLLVNRLVSRHGGVLAEKRLGIISATSRQIESRKVSLSGKIKDMKSDAANAIAMCTSSLLSSRSRFRQPRFIGLIEGKLQLLVTRRKRLALLANNQYGLVQRVLTKRQDVMRQRVGAGLQTRVLSLTKQKRRFHRERFLAPLRSGGNTVQRGKHCLVRTAKLRLEQEAKTSARRKAGFQLEKFLMPIKSQHRELSLHKKFVDSVDPVKNLQRGYALIYSEQNVLLVSERQLNIGDSFRMQMVDGQISAEVKGKKRDG